MIHFCIMGAHEGELTAERKVCVTIFGACELKRPTLAKQIIEMRQNSHTGAPVRSHFFITICGATELLAPTLAEEYLAMQEAIRAGTLTVEEWDAAIAQLGSDSGFQYGSLTLMGGFDSNGVPEESAEVDGLAINQHLGRIPEPAGRTLEFGVGRSGSERAAVVRQAFASAAATAAAAG